MSRIYVKFISMGRGICSGLGHTLALQPVNRMNLKILPIRLRCLVTPRYISVVLFQLASGGGGGRGLFCYHCPPSLPPHQHRLPTLEYPFTASHPCKWTKKTKVQCNQQHLDLVFLFLVYIMELAIYIYLLAKSHTCRTCDDRTGLHNTEEF